MRGIPDMSSLYSYPDRLAWEAGEIGDELHGEPDFDENGQPIINGMEIRTFFEEEREMNIKDSQAKEFWRDLMGTLRFSTKGTHGIMSVGLIADHMNISVEKANAFLRRCAEDDLRLTERQGGGWVV